LKLYQAQKALSTAELFVREEGIIILIAECPNGTGGENFIQWMRDSSHPGEIVERFRNEGYSSVGVSKAFMFARALLKSRVLVVSDRLSPDQLEDTFLEHASTLSQAVDHALNEMGNEAKILVLPEAINLLPEVAVGK